MRALFTTALELLGMGLIVAGFAAMSLELGLIAGGFALLAVGVRQA